jgi:D-3-phosphoglycerate dehydrogenase
MERAFHQDSNDSGWIRMNILITAPFDNKIIEKLEVEHKVFYESWEETMFFGKGEKLVERLDKDEIDILVTEVDKVDEFIFKSYPKLKMICDCRGNPSNIDIAAATKYEVVVTNTPGRNAVAVAEFCLGLILNLTRHINKGHKVVLDGDWDWGVYFTLQGTEISMKTIGLVGFGAVARALAKLLQGFDMRILAYDPYVADYIAKELNTELVDLDTLFKNSDILSIHLPVTDETKGLISAEKLALMKPSAYFVNTGRAATVDETALIRMLRENKIAGGAFDVFGTEPLPAEHEYSELENVVLTPHIGGASKEVAKHQAAMVLEDILHYLQGKKPPRMVNQELEI